MEDGQRGSVGKETSKQRHEGRERDTHVFMREGHSRQRHSIGKLDILDEGQK